MAELNASGKKMKVGSGTMVQEKVALKGNTFLKLPDVFTQNSIPVTKDNIPKEEDIRKWHYLKDVELTPIDASIGLLIGVNAPNVLEPWKVINSEGNGLFAVKTLLGWVINGPLSHRVDSDMCDCPPVHDFAEQHYEKKEMSMEDKQFI